MGPRERLYQLGELFPRFSRVPLDPRVPLNSLVPLDPLDPSSILFMNRGVGMNPLPSGIPSLFPELPAVFSYEGEPLLEAATFATSVEAPSATSVEAPSSTSVEAPSATSVEAPSADSFDPFDFHIPSDKDMEEYLKGKNLEDAEFV